MMEGNNSHKSLDWLIKLNIMELLTKFPPSVEITQGEIREGLQLGNRQVEVLEYLIERVPQEFEFNTEHKRDLLYAGLLTPFRHLEYENKKKKEKD